MIADPPVRALETHAVVVALPREPVALALAARRIIEVSLVARVARGAAHARPALAPARRPVALRVRLGALRLAPARCRNKGAGNAIAESRPAIGNEAANGCARPDDRRYSQAMFARSWR